MNEIGQDWERKLSSPPLRNGGFSNELMRSIEEQAAAINGRPGRRTYVPWISGIAVAAAVVLLLLFSQKEDLWRMALTSDMTHGDGNGGSVAAEEEGGQTPKGTSASAGEPDSPNSQREPDNIGESGGPPTNEPNINEPMVITDCSKLVIPEDVSIDTHLDTKRGVIAAYWWDNEKGENVAVQINYKEATSCSERVQWLINHVLETGGVVKDEAEKNDVDINFVKNNLRIGQVQPLVQKFFGSNYNEIKYTGIEGGEEYAIYAWRYDIGVKDGFEPETRVGHEGWSHSEAIEAGNIQAQLIVYWKEEKSEGKTGTRVWKVDSFAYEYKAEDGKLRVYAVSPDGETIDG
jgi:hypothetical protein